MSMKLVTRTMLAEHVSGTDSDPMSNVIDVHIARLRRKIDDGRPEKLLQTIRGRGYTLRSGTPAPETAEDSAPADEMKPLKKRAQ